MSTQTVVDRLRAVSNRYVVLGVAIATVVLYFVLVVLGDLSEVRRSVSDVDRSTLLVALGIVTLSYVVRLLRWVYYLDRAEESVPLARSSVVFVSGLAMAVTPGKFGEVWKAGFLSQLEGVPTEKTTAVVGAERITDLFGVSSVATLGMLFGLSPLLPVVTCLGVGGFVGIVLLASRRERLPTGERLREWEIVQNHLDRIETFQTILTEVLQPPVFALGTALGCVAWLLEGVAFWVILDALGVEIGVSYATVVFALGTLIGAVSLLPGGIGAVEASLVGLLVTTGLPLAVATTATLLLRAVTLWYGVSLGAATFTVYQLWSRSHTDRR